MSMELATPGRQELEAMSLAERVALEDAFGQAHDLIRELNDDEIRRLAEAGMSQRALAEVCGRSPSWVRARLGALAPSEAKRLNNQDVPQNGDAPHDAAEVVDAEVVDEPERPAHYLPDVVSPDAESNLRTQTLHWFEQGRSLEELLAEGATVEARDKDDRAAIKREAAEMVRIARLLKGATK